MGRPDRERLSRNAGVVFAGAGETATLRTYVSASAGAPRYGVGDQPAYTERTITGMFASDIFGAPRPTERDRAGGVAQDARLMVTTPEPLGSRDVLVWRDTAYRLAGEAMPQHLGGQLMWRSPLALATVTG